MSIYCIADFHLSNEVDKPMHKFGERWMNHDQKLWENLHAVVNEKDTILIPGDISWSITWQEAAKDMSFINQLPGRKILLRGNHDYWWGTLSKNYRALEELGIKNIDFLQNNAYRIEDEDAGNILVAGTRGWIFPNDPKWLMKDKKILQREVQRLRISLEAAETLRQENDRLIVMTHFPPFNNQLAISEFTKLMKEHSVELGFFGHIHHASSPYHIWGHEIDGVKFYLSACDQIKFQPLKVDEYLE